MIPLLQVTNSADPIFSERIPGKNGGKMRGKMAIFTAFLLSGGVALLFLSTPAAAQSPTVTPYPGPILTATAAAYRMEQAQAQQRQGSQMKAEAEAQRARAAQLEMQGNDAINTGTAAYNAAAEDAKSAAAAIQAQQIGSANEFNARAQTNIETGKSQIDTARDTITQLRSIVDMQASTIISLTDRVQRAEMSAATIQKAYTATVAQQESDQRLGTIIVIFLGVVFLAFMFAVFAIVARKWNSRTPAPPQPAPSDPPAASPIDSEWQDVTNETQPDN